MASVRRPAVAAPVAERVVVVRRRLPIAVRWALRLVAAAALSVVAGFVVGLARPRAKVPGA